MSPALAPRGPGAALRDLLFVSGTVTEIRFITGRTMRIRLEGPRVSSLPGQHVRVHVSDMLDPRNWLRPRDILRTYSIWRHDDDGIELCVLDHGGEGPGAQWARGLNIGQAVSFGRPEGSFVLREGPYHVFAGEETAAVTFGAMLRALPAGTPAYGIIEVDEPEDRLPIEHELPWRYRQGRSAAASQSLVDAFAELELPASPGLAYLAGEARTIQLLRRHLVTERGWPRQAIQTKPYWTPGKRGLDLVPAAGLLVRPRGARRSIRALDVPQPPRDLGRGIGAPVRTRAGHLGAGQRLRDPVGAGAGVVRRHAPPAFALPQRVEAGELARRPAVTVEHSPGDVRDRPGCPCGAGAAEPRLVDPVRSR
jgi:NADPH-dependent ferric siderophore reductase